MAPAWTCSPLARLGLTLHTDTRSDVSAPHVDRTSHKDVRRIPVSAIGSPPHRESSDKAESQSGGSRVGTREFFLQLTPTHTRHEQSHSATVHRRSRTFLDIDGSTHASEGSRSNLPPPTSHFLTQITHIADQQQTEPLRHDDECPATIYAHTWSA